MGLLNAVDLYRFYHSNEEETLALRGVSLEVKAGEIVAVMGPSGSGKSTLLSCLAGLDEPDGGYVEVMGQRITRRPEEERAAIRSAEIGILLQSGNLFEHLTVEENILLQMSLAHRGDRKRMNDLLNRTGISHRRSAYPEELSGGEAARAGMAVALSTNPSILLADEPTGEVDSETEKHIINLFESVRNERCAILVATHSETLASYANRIVHLRDGMVVGG
ncbi:ABC transporter [Thermincola ferriacetica]|uniref:ABC transporter n=1 Tax=Thermincola ferriacetica TaxID=281456 RepID=A0A0L6W2I1_9FIRM|nr:ABC transporter ATP-binding protein [Thermincola ferriacetica]KNZ69676.1 ABC transporter [Thermincola ferriacetica]